MHLFIYIYVTSNGEKNKEIRERLPQQRTKVKKIDCVREVENGRHISRIVMQRKKRGLKSIRSSLRYKNRKREREM
jgi:hypothetical protein